MFVYSVRNNIENSECVRGREFGEYGTIISITTAGVSGTLVYCDSSSSVNTDYNYGRNEVNDNIYS